MLVSSRRKSPPALRLESLEERLVLASVVFSFETQINLFNSSFLTIRVFQNSAPPSVTPPSTPSVQQSGVFSLIGFQRLILNDLIDSFAGFATPNTTQTLASSGAAAGSQGATSVSAATRGNAATILNNVAAAAGVTDNPNSLLNAYGVLRALAYNPANVPVPVNTLPAVSTATLNSNAALAGLANSLLVPSLRSEIGRINLTELPGDKEAALGPDMKRIPEAGAKPMQPMMPAPEKTAPDKGADLNQPGPSSNQEEPPAMPTPSGEASAAASLSLTWVDPTETTPETSRVWEGPESLRSYAATLTVALVINGWWNKPAAPVTEERDRRRQILRRWPT